MTQLYVSVDASTKESLKRIDRPLFRDFWPRFIGSLEALSEKVSELWCCRNIPSRLLSSVCFPFLIQGQRTVYRLTLVKEWNTEELEAYASLVAKGNPDFIEIKVLPLFDYIKEPPAF